jgi:hypothetical protein
MGSYRYRVTVGDTNAQRVYALTDDINRAENYASELLGTQWKEYSLITETYIYKFNGERYESIKEERVNQ